ncbi:MAG: hypothetical protein BWY82_01438 [Verrucomicrobia bacterium ADurb.Bin474]|nr:MAG: hypothetical protein BWY82_01438 [Verrucomicrobia bacterium ADurb.Bin474]
MRDACGEVSRAFKEGIAVHRDRRGGGIVEAQGGIWPDPFQGNIEGSCDRSTHIVGIIINVIAIQIQIAGPCVEVETIGPTGNPVFGIGRGNRCGCRSDFDPNRLTG